MKKLMFTTFIFSMTVSFIYTDAMAASSKQKKPDGRLIRYDAPFFGVAGYHKLKSTDSRKDSWRVSKNHRPPRKIPPWYRFDRRPGYPVEYKEVPPMPPADRFLRASEPSDSYVETENSSDEGYWKTNKTWIEPVYDEIQVPGYYNKRGQWIEGYSQPLVVKEGYWDEKKVWTYY